MAKMTWDERRADHMRQAEAHMDAARKALKEFGVRLDRRYFDEYLKEMKAANRQYGYVWAMHTNKMKKLNAE